MRTFKTVLIDDEKKSTDILEYLIRRHCKNLDIITVFNNPQTGLTFIEDNDIDLLLLDIQMPGLDGFQILDSLSAIDFNVVFVTAHDEYAIKAFKYYAIDYLLKPVDTKELKDLAARLYFLDIPKYDKSDYHQIINSMSKPESKLKHLAVPTSKGVEFIKIEDILRLEADSNYTYIVKINGAKVYAAKTLKHFEGLLPASDFFRPHQSHIININCMTRYVRGDGGYILMEDGKEIGLARSKRQEFMERFGL